MDIQREICNTRESASEWGEEVKHWLELKRELVAQLRSDREALGGRTTPELIHHRGETKRQMEALDYRWRELGEQWLGVEHQWRRLGHEWEGQVVEWRQFDQGIERLISDKAPFLMEWSVLQP